MRRFAKLKAPDNPALRTPRLGQVSGETPPHKGMKETSGRVAPAAGKL